MVYLYVLLVFLSASHSRTKAKNCLCLNGGVCVANNNTTTTTSEMQCACLDGYTGKFCETEINHCESAPCLNGGVCFNNVNGFSCACAEGFGGKKCSTDLQERCKEMCVHGLCEKGACECHQGWSGLTCQDESCPSECNQQFSECNQACNIPQCQFDHYRCTLGIDPFKGCRKTSCRQATGDGRCDVECNIAECLFDGGDCRNRSTCDLEEKCSIQYGNQRCDKECDNAGCGYDALECRSNVTKNLLPGKLVLDISSNQNQTIEEISIERSLSILLNSRVNVVEIRRGGEETVNRRKRNVKSSDRQSVSLRTTLDNGGCMRDCFHTVNQAARYIAFKASKQQLDHLPFKVRSVAVEKDSAQKEDDVINKYLWLFTLFVIAIVLMFGIWYQRRQKGTSLWVPPTLTELANSPRNETSSAVPRKMCKEIRPSHMPILHSDDEDLEKESCLPSSSANEDEGTDCDHKEKIIKDNPYILHFAIHYGFMDLFKEQLDDLKNINLQDHNGRTPLHVAIALQRHEMFEELIAVKGIDLNIRDGNGETPLMEACNAYSTDQVQKLLKAGSKATLTNRQGKTALHVSAQIDNYQAVRLLVEVNSNVNKQDSMGRTPLHLAILEDSEQSTIILLQSGSNTSIRDTDGLTPLALCQISKNERLEILLRDHEEKKGSDDDLLPRQQKVKKKVESHMTKKDTKPKKKDRNQRTVDKRARLSRKRKKLDSVCSSSTLNDSLCSLSPEIKLPFCESAHQETRKRQWSETHSNITHGYTSDECSPYKEMNGNKLLRNHDNKSENNSSSQEPKKMTKKCKINTKRKQFPSVDCSTDGLESPTNRFDFGFNLSSMMNKSLIDNDRMFEDDVFVGSNVLHQALTCLIDPLPTLTTSSWSTDAHSPISDTSF
ncbi:neurogenic locus notch homolog protein 2-like isoform X1 [Clytia hemisphaerica]|uniref:Notch n=2 Tax=Clytia hemisphaerica TaxID=252671 RepID=A0A7M6DQY3_9CNID